MRATVSLVVLVVAHQDSRARLVVQDYQAKETAAQMIPVPVLVAVVVVLAARRLIKTAEQDLRRIMTIRLLLAAVAAVEVEAQHRQVVVLVVRHPMDLAAPRTLVAAAVVRKRRAVRNEVVVTAGPAS